MRNLISTTSLILVLHAANANAGVIYELIENGTGDVRATLNFDAAIASSSSSWIAPTGASLSSILEGGISGFMVDFGGGFETAMSGDLDHLGVQEFFSADGSELDFGHYQFGGVVSFASFDVFRVSADNFAGADGLAALGSPNFGFSGNWVLQTSPPITPIPEPGTLALVTASLLGMVLARRKMIA